MAYTELDLVVLASLLHDIGKFAQRAEAPRTEGMEQEYCPEGKTHLHVLYTDNFIERELPLPSELEGARSLLARMASAHHRPNGDSLAECCIRDADCLSSGGDRVLGDSGGDYKRARLESLFNILSLGNAPRKESRYALLPLEADEAIFPMSAGQAQQTGYKELWGRFLGSLNALPLDMGVRHYLHSVQTVLERWTWCIPSSTYHTRADISLFDHATTTAAIAQALYAGGAAGDPAFFLFGGELSGIQNYIFAAGGQANKGAGKLLRARSFVLQMLTRSFWLTLLERCELAHVARIMDAGGRFILLLPATEAVRGQTDRLEAEAERHLLDTYHGVLRATFARTELARRDLEMIRFQDCFNLFNDQLERNKLQPFRHLLAEGLPAALPLSGADYAKYGECAVCGFRPAQTLDEGQRPLCPECDRLITQIGHRLPTARYALFQRGDGFALFGGLRLRLEETPPAPRDKTAPDILDLKRREAYTALPVAGFIPHITEDELRQWRAEGRFAREGDQLVLDGERFSPDDAKTFALLGALSRLPAGAGWRSVPALAACKADVDNLGMLFSIGFGTGDKSLLSISRFASLSRMLHHFFSSWLVRVVEREFPNIYVIFAGGDDLFVLGPWADTVRFAQRLRDDFRRFADGNPDVTLSAGIPLAKARLPVPAIRAQAEALLEAAKKQPEKDAVSLFGVTCRWDMFATRLEQGYRFEDLCLKGTLSQGFVRRVLGYARACQAFRAGDINKGLFLSHMRYDLARNGAALADNDRLWLLALPCQTDFPETELSVVWALYRTRQSSQE